MEGVVSSFLSQKKQKIGFIFSEGNPRDKDLPLPHRLVIFVLSL